MTVLGLQEWIMMMKPLKRKQMETMILKKRENSLRMIHWRRMRKKKMRTIPNMVMRLKRKMKTISR